MYPSQTCRAVCHYFEGWSNTAYPDPATGGAPWTIGRGHTGPEVKAGLVWTDEQGEAAFDRDIHKFAGYAQRIVDGCRFAVTQGQFDGLTLILFNVGPGSPIKDGILRLRTGAPSTLVRRFQAGEIDAAADQFLLWNKAAGRVMLGLTRRRAAEREVFLGATAEHAIAVAKAIE